jgi:hypothetical protein
MIQEHGTFRHRSPVKVLATPVLAAGILLAGCNDDDPVVPAVPDLTGVHAAEWDLTLTEPTTGEGDAWTCPGQITIDSQAGSAFSGTFLVTEVEGCELTGGELAGEVDADGRVRFSLVPTDPPVAESFLEALTGCEVLGADDGFEGIYDSGELSASVSAVVECEFAHFGEVILDLDVSVQATRE